MKHPVIRPGPAILVLLVAILFLAAPLVPAWAGNEFDNYGNNHVDHIVLPEVMGGWFDAIDFFPGKTGNGSDINATIGSYEVAGRLVVANHKTIYLQKNYGSGCPKGSWSVGDDDLVSTNPDVHILPGGNENFIPVATVAIVNEYPVGMGSMDPSFIKVSPDGDKIALGMGWGQPLLIIDISVLDPENPPLLNGSDGLSPIAGVKEWTSPSVEYYDAEWVDNERLAMNADYGWDPGLDRGTGSQVDILDVTNQSNSRVTVINHIGVGSSGGASADVTIDLEGHIITGNGYDYSDDSHTGELMMFHNSDWESAYGSQNPLNYQAEGYRLADNVLSAAQLGVDKDNNLHVGGGSWLGGEGGELGYAAIIHAYVLEDVMYYGGGPLDESDPYQYRTLAPDPRGDDSATSPVVYNPWSEGLSVVWNPNGGYGIAGSDLWCTGIRPIMTTYYGEDPPDRDGDNIPDGSDNAYLTPNSGQQDTDGDGWGNAADGDFDNDGSVGFSDFNYFKSKFGTADPDADMNSNGNVEYVDFVRFKKQYGQDEPFY